MSLFQFASNWLDRLCHGVDARMQETLRVGVDTARDDVHVITGYLKSTISGEYRQSDRTILLHADAPYALIEAARGGAHDFFNPACNAMAAMWGGSFELHFPHAAGSLASVRRQEVRLHSRFSGGRGGVASRVRIVSRRWHRWSAEVRTFESTPLL